MKKHCISLLAMLLALTLALLTPAAAEDSASQKAQSYLSILAFSRKGLIEQLEFDGYSHAEAEAAVDACGADWNDQAARKAIQYLDTTAFSEKGLTDQLEFDGFTASEASFGVSRCGADWNEQAAKKAAQYLDLMSFTTQKLIDQLEFDGFTHSQAVYGAAQNGYGDAPAASSMEPSDNSASDATSGGIPNTEKEFVDYLNSLIENMGGGNEDFNAVVRLEYYQNMDDGSAAYTNKLGNALFVTSENDHITRLVLLCRHLGYPFPTSKESLTTVEEKVEWNIITDFMLAGLAALNPDDIGEIVPGRDSFYEQLKSSIVASHEFTSCSLYYSKSGDYHFYTIEAK